MGRRRLRLSGRQWNLVAGLALMVGGVLVLIWLCNSWWIEQQSALQAEMEVAAGQVYASQLLLGNPEQVFAELGSPYDLAVFGHNDGKLRIATNPNSVPDTLPEPLWQNASPSDASSVLLAEPSIWRGTYRVVVLVPDRSSADHYWVWLGRQGRLAELPGYAALLRAGWGILALGLIGLGGLGLQVQTQRQQVQWLAQRVRRLDPDATLEVGEFTLDDEVARLWGAVVKTVLDLRQQIQHVEQDRATLDVVLAQIQDGILVVTDEGLVTYINPMAAALFNTNPAAAIGRTLAQVFFDHRLLDLWERYRVAGEEQALALDLSLRNRYVQVIVAGFGPQMPDHALVLIQDLTRMRRLETVRRDFVSNISHELRTPLASLKALAETLKAGAMDDPKAAARFLDLMDGEVDALTQLTAELLELARIEAGQSLSVFRPTWPCELVTQAVQRLEVQAQRAGLQLVAECPPDLPVVQVDPERLVQVLVNLIHNAIKFSQPGGTIQVLAGRSETGVEFRVIDTGIGIPAKHLPRIFERFYKADPARASGGTGLGLAIAKHIVELHHGTLGVDSREGAGTTFTIRLPTTDAAELLTKR